MLKAKEPEKKTPWHETFIKEWEEEQKRKTSRLSTQSAKGNEEEEEEESDEATSYDGPTSPRSTTSGGNPNMITASLPGTLPGSSSGNLLSGRQSEGGRFKKPKVHVSTLMQGIA
jgi:hypothetical protein